MLPPPLQLTPATQERGDQRQAYLATLRSLAAKLTAPPTGLQGCEEVLDKIEVGHTGCG